MARLNEVFGISTIPVLSYVERPAVDGKFVEALAGQHHIVIYGASKQGKTTLRQKYLPEDKSITYRCNPRSSTLAIFQHVLGEAGVTLQVTDTRTTGAKVTGKIGVNAFLPYQAELGSEASRQTESRAQYIDQDIGDAQVVASLLKRAGLCKFIVIENFHYLPQDVQDALAIDLKTFHEVGIRFMILGVWRESNQLFARNPDLQDRVAEIPVEPWTHEEFDDVTRKGEDELNIEVHPDAVAQFKTNAYGNVGLFQEFLRVYCNLNGVAETKIARQSLPGGTVIAETLKAKAQEQRQRLVSTLERISTKSRGERREGRVEPLTLPYYLVKVLLSASIQELQDGVSRQHLLDHIRLLHRREDKSTIRPSDVSHLLRRLPALQADSPTPFLYQANQTLKIADAGLLFALANLDRQRIADEDILDPLETYESDLDLSFPP